MAPAAVYIGRGKFRSEISGGKTCTPPQANTRRKLHSHNRMGRQKIHSALHYTGITNEDKCIFHYQDTSRSISSSSATNNRKSKTNHTQASLLSMGPNTNLPRNHNRHHFFKRRERNLFNKYVEIIFLGRAVNSTLLCPISVIAPQSANPTEETMKQKQKLLYYTATQEEAILTYSRSDTKLAVHSDASYLSEPNAQSRSGSHYFYPTKQRYHKTTAQFLTLTT